MRGALICIGLLFVLVSSSSPEWGEPVNLGPNVNWAGMDYYPSISADGMKLYFTSCGRAGGFGDDDIWISRWDGTKWSVPVNAGPNINWEWRDLSPSISSDGTKLYFVSWGRPGGYGSYDVWVSTWEDTMWGPATNLGPSVNSAYDEFTTNISSDGRRLYFSSNRPGGFGDDDIWVSDWDSAKGNWDDARNLGLGVNSFAAEYCPCISSDGTRLYLARWGKGLGFVDIWVSEWEDTTWGLPVDLGAPVNTPTWDDGPSISVDGAKLYFASSRDTNNPAVQDIWVSEWIPGIQERDLKPKAGDCRMRNEPNPSRSGTFIRFSLPDGCRVSLKVFDATGRLARILVDGSVESGNHEIFWDGTNEKRESVKSGVYFYALTAGNLRRTGKIVVIH
jgi:Tol biopolymer transport system component